MVLDGSARVDAILRAAMPWDVMGGVARRAWARNPNSIATCQAYNAENAGTDHITLPHVADDDLVARLVQTEFAKR
jgi:urocanate hydratase